MEILLLFIILSLLILLTFVIVVTFQIGLAIFSISSSGPILELFTICLAVLALLPFCLSVYYYLFKKPKLKFQIVSKSKHCNHDMFFYDMMFGMSCEKGKLLLSKLYITTDLDEIESIKHPNDTSDFHYESPVEGGGFTYPSVISYGQTPFFEKNARGHLLRFKSNKELEEFMVTFYVDVENDPIKLKFWSIFQTNYKYRLSTKVSIEFKQAGKQAGYFSLL